MIFTIGHLPPPITGENLCRARLEEALKARGQELLSMPRGRGCFRRAETTIIVNGESLAGTVFDLVLTAWALLTGQRVFWYFHNASWQRFAHLPAWLWLGGKKQILAVVLRQTIADGLIRAGYRAVVLNNRIEEVFETELRPLPASPPKRIVWMGRPNEEKGFPLALAAFELLHSEDKQWRMDVFGADAAYAQVQGYGREGVNWHGFIHGGDKVTAFCEGGIFILPSLLEVQPLSIIEAMACGVPVVASNVGGIQEMLRSDSEEAGFSLSSRSAKEYAEAILRIMADYPRYSATAKAIYKERFSIARFQEAVDEVFLIKN